MNTHTESFLLQVVKKIFNEKREIKNLVFVLPNQRAGIHLKRYLKDQITNTTLFPEIQTFDNLALQIADLSKIGTTPLLFEFYIVYKNELKEKAESFEQFLNWATTVLNDFNEIDAYLVNPKHIFSNLKEINRLQNWDPNSKLTQNYLSFFQDLEKMYHALYESLLSQKMGYQGLIFKEALSAITTFIANTDKHYIFIGFNHLKESESQIIQELLEVEKASIYWDVSKQILTKDNNAGLFINHYVSTWKYYTKNTVNWILDKPIKPDTIEIIGSSKNVGMIKYVGELLEQVNNPNDTALVLADQNILPITLNSLPKNIESVNITMGLPLQNFHFSDLVKAFFELQIQAQSQENGYFYYKNIIKISQHPIIVSSVKGIDVFLKKIKEKNTIYYSEKELQKSSKENCLDYKVVACLFKKSTTIKTLLIQLNTLINFLKEKTSGYQKDVLFKHYQLNQQLIVLNEKYKEINRTGSLKTFYQIYIKLLLNDRISFIGEPLKGLQIMGFLETQALSFNHLIITSLNEGVLPKGKQNNSFIPFDIRKHFGLLTYIEKNAIDSYNFQRLIASAGKITLLYNNQTDTFGGGEKSQFITQLLWKHPTIREKIINPLVISNPKGKPYINKTPEIISKLETIVSKGISPSALTSYIYNPYTFYQQRILSVYEIDTVEETVADNTLGTVIHNSLENLYTPYVKKTLTEEKLKKLFPIIRETVKICFQNEYHTGQIKEGKNKLIFEVIVQFIIRFITDEIRLIKQGRIIRIIALEKTLSTTVKFPSFEFPIKFKGIVDRIDEIDGVVRIIDYKSGKVMSSQLNSIDFTKLTKDYKYSKALQVLLYSYMYTKNSSYDASKKLQAGIISFKNLHAGFMPVSFGRGKNQNSLIKPKLIEQFLLSIETLLIEIFNKDIPFTSTEK